MRCADERRENAGRRRNREGAAPDGVWNRALDCLTALQLNLKRRKTQDCDEMGQETTARNHFERKTGCSSARNMTRKSPGRQHLHARAHQDYVTRSQPMHPISLRIFAVLHRSVPHSCRRCIISRTATGFSRSMGRELRSDARYSVENSNLRQHLLGETIEDSSSGNTENACRGENHVTRNCAPQTEAPAPAASGVAERSTGEGGRDRYLRRSRRGHEENVKAIDTKRCSRLLCAWQTGASGCSKSDRVKGGGGG
jgi:hypothetical protein